MIDAGALPFRLGCAAPESVSGAYCHFYRWVSKVAVGGDCSLLGGNEQTTLAVSNEVIQNRTHKVYEFFSERVQQWDPLPQVIVVDFFNPFDGIVRAPLLIQLTAALGAFITSRKAVIPERPVVCVLLLRDLPTERESHFEDMARLVNEGTLIIVSDQGETLSGAGVRWSVPPEQYRLNLVAARGEPRELLRKKIICRLGHYKRIKGNKHDHCVRYFYDGTLCYEEIAELLLRHVQQAYAGSRPAALYYYSKDSAWLERAVMDVCTRQNIEPRAIDLSRKGDHLLGPRKAEASNPVVVVDMVDTGSTLSRIIGGFLERGATQPEIIAVLTTDKGILDREQYVREIQVDSRKYQINYLCEVTQDELPLGECEMCQLDIPDVGVGLRNEPYMLTSYDMWGMVFEAGTKPEDDRPRHREALASVPKFPQIIEKHGAWLVSKIRDLLESQLSGFPTDPIAICPDREKGSTMYTDYLRLVLGISVIRIPRSVIDACALGVDEIARHEEAWKTERAEWYVNLLSMVTGQFIIMDEFNVSGRTFKGLRNLLRRYGKEIVCYFPLVDMNPYWTEHCGTETYSLYSWQVVTRRPMAAA